METLALNGLRGLGNTDWIVSNAVNTAAASQTKDQKTTSSFWDVANKVIGTAQGAADVYSTVKGSNAPKNNTSTPYSNAVASGSYTPPADQKKDNTMKYVAIGGGLLALAGVSIAIYKRGKKDKK